MKWFLEKIEPELRDIVDQIIEFHHHDAPGVIMGVYMVEEARKHMKPLVGKMNAIAESGVCLPDPIQMMTGCTVGNKYLHILDCGRYALCLYDRETKEGVRVYIDYDKIDAAKTPILKRFFDGTRSYEKIPRPEQQKMAIEEFLQVKTKIFGVTKVWVDKPAKPPLRKNLRCPSCNEYFKQVSDETECKWCSEYKQYCSEPISKDSEI